MINSKYNNVLTILLVVAIIAIIGVLGFFGYDWYRKKYIEKENEEILQRFEQELQNNVNSETNEIEGSGTIDLNIVDSSILNSSSGGTAKKTKYKGFTVEGTIEIPKIDLKYPILNGVTKKSLETSVAMFSGPGLNQVGNTVIMGHNYRNGTFFSNVKKLIAGDSIYITDYTGQRMEYKVTKIYTTLGSDSSYIERETNGKREITLSTCTDDGSGVILVWAAEV